MNRKLYIQSLLFALLGIGLLFLSFRKTNFQELFEVLHSGNYWVAIPVFIVSVLVYVARVMRWQLLYKTIDIPVSSNYLFAALAAGYLVNFVVPRLGEITRTLILKNALQLPVNKSLSTVIFERLADIICLGLILATAFTFEFSREESLFHPYTQNMIVLTPAKLGLIVFLIAAIVIVYFRIRNQHNGISEWISGLVKSLFELTKIRQPLLFLFYTITIWFGFFLMTYLWFFMFRDSMGLSLYQAFLVMTLGAVARSLPIQAGSAGAYHFVVSQALFMMGVNLVTANALAIVIHGFQTIVTLFFGFSAYIWLFNKERINAT